MARAEEREAQFAGTAYENSGLVVTNQLGGCVEPRTFKDYYNKLLSDAQLTHFTFHALRHTFATRALELGMDVKTLSAILGHANVGFALDTYAHVLDSHKRESMQLMQPLYAQKEKQPRANNAVVFPGRGAAKQKPAE